jgi:glycosyltransferase involved in cell wall biosynthesis
MLNCVQAVVANSPDDATLLKSITNIKRTYYVPIYSKEFHVPKTDGRDACKDATVARFDLLFVGANNQFNVEGLAEFVAACPRAAVGRRIAVAGRMCADPRVQALAARHPNTTLLGFVEDLSKLYRQAAAVLSPVEGTGLKIKLIQALGHGKPVFASRHSMDGLPVGYEDCVLPLDDRSIDLILDDEAARRAAEAAARAYYDVFQTAGDLQPLLKFLKEACAEP